MLTKEGMYELLCKKHAGEKLPDNWEQEVFNSVQMYAKIVDSCKREIKAIQEELAEAEKTFKTLKEGMGALKNG